ncbi:hypothetical protein HDU67_009952 [Dinochytrium kinnereticum]|nr:hypothetical protein HDU67_009952 [Dinochytrium kinnereticum]
MLPITSSSSRRKTTDTPPLAINLSQPSLAVRASSPMRSVLRSIAGLSRQKLVFVTIICLALGYLSFSILRSPHPYITYSTSSPSSSSPYYSSSSDFSWGSSARKKSSASSNEQIGEPLFDAPNTPFDRALTSLRNASDSLQSGKSTRTGDSKYDRFAVALKTGAEVAVERASIQLVTFLKKINNLVIIGESPGIHIGDHPMIDVYSGVYDLVDRRIAAMEKKEEAGKKKQKGSPMPDDFELIQPQGDVTPKRRRGLQRRSKEDAVVPAEDSRGWKLDAHKNLPGFEYLYKTYPNADWFVMIDDDSYVFFDNLDRYLKEKDPNKPHYIGSANVFLGCDGVTNFGDGPLFAHGGSGIVISRGAIKMMMGGIEKCIRKYRDCWAGDVRVALCLRDLGVLITPGKGFEKEPPNDDIQRLYEIETTSTASHPKTGVTTADILHSFNPVRPSAETDYDRPGHDFDHKPCANARMCEGYCFGTARCLAWAFDGATCWMKDGVGKREKVNGVLSGVIVDRYRC